MTPPDDYNHFPCRLTPPDPGTPSLPDEEGRIPHYEDTGCSFSPSCLSCPLPRCVLDMTPSEVAQLRRARLRGGRPLTATETAVESLVAQGATLDGAIGRIAAQEGVTKQAIYLRMARQSTRPVRTGKKLTPHELVRALQELLATGMKRSAAIRRLASANGVSTQTINHRIRQARPHPPEEN